MYTYSRSPLSSAAALTFPDLSLPTRHFASFSLKANGLAMFGISWVALPRSGSRAGGQLLAHNVPHHHTVPPTLNSDHSEMLLSLKCQALSHPRPLLCPWPGTLPGLHLTLLASAEMVEPHLHQIIRWRPLPSARWPHAPS